MSTKAHDRKIFYTLIFLSLCTTPLFGLLGGTPFLTFDFSEFRYFLSGVIFVSVVTLLCWIINISLLMMAAKISILKKIFVRAIISILLTLSLSITLFNFFKPMGPGPKSFMDNKQLNATVITPVNPNSKVFIERLPFKIPDRNSIFFFPQIIRSFTINLIILTLCELVFVYYRKQKIEMENALLKQSNLEAKNNQLRMQLHPHFLFNSLNTLRLLLKKDVHKAEDYLLKLSDILRITTTSALQPLSNLEDELQLCLSYLDMQKVRFGNMLDYNITGKDIHTAEGALPVYALQLLAENAIKHNTFTTEKPLFISIGYDAELRTITVKNKLQPRTIIEQTTKTGLKNLRERYALLGIEGMSIEEKEQEFIVTIKVLN